LARLDSRFDPPQPSPALSAVVRASDNDVNEE
jgi:hypothetical protein